MWLLVGGDAGPGENPTPCIHHMLWRATNVCHTASQTRAWVSVAAIARPHTHAISWSWRGNRSSPRCSSAFERNSTAISSVRPGRAGRAVIEADARAPAQLLKRAMSERAAARSWDACPAAPASSVPCAAVACTSTSACVTACWRVATHIVISDWLWRAHSPGSPGLSASPFTVGHYRRRLSSAARASSSATVREGHLFRRRQPVRRRWGLQMRAARPSLHLRWSAVDPCPHWLDAGRLLIRCGFIVVRFGLASLAAPSMLVCSLNLCWFLGVNSQRCGAYSCFSV